MPRNHILIPGETMVVLVDTSTERTSRFSWSELHGIVDQVAARASDPAAANNKLIPAVNEQMVAATIAAAESPGGPTRREPRCRLRCARYWSTT